jgi:DNA-binding response OmpR family regulator
MNIQNLIICDSKNIFDILDEIKEELNCNLLFKSKEDLVKTKNLQDYLILSKQAMQGIDNQIIIKNFPIRINDLIEKINISFLKKNFNLQSEIIIGNYKINLNSRVIFKESKSVSLTEKETLIILHLDNKDEPSNINELQKLVWKQSADLDTHTVETHIYRLRKKIKDKFNDENFIVSSKNGYKIV